MSDDHSARLQLPYLAAGQMQKHVTLNEALTRLDALVQTAVASRTVAVEPAASPDGEMYILPAGAVGDAWSGFSAGDLVRAEGGAWSRIAMSAGALAFVVDDGEFVVRDDEGDWIRLLGQIGELERLGLGTTADADNPFAAKLNKALWTALPVAAGGDGDLRLTLNKEAAGDVLSLLFQSGYGGRAELGLVGSDDLVLKVSADGAVWHQAFTVDRATGQTVFELGVVRRETTVLTANGSWAPPGWARSVEAVAVGAGGGGGAGHFSASGNRYGGGGGGAGGVCRAVWPADQVAAGLTVVVGARGTAGAALAGGAGGASSVSLGAATLLSATGGGGGGLGGAASGTGGTAGIGLPNSNGGGASSVSTAGGTGKSFDRPDAPGGGGAGGGLDSGGVARAGGAGGDGGALAVKAMGGAAGSGVAGSAGAAAPLPTLHWAGGGGGGGAAVVGAGHPGASGGFAGGGGGGGGAGVTAGGAGGLGGAGVVWLTALG